MLQARDKHGIICLSFLGHFTHFLWQSSHNTLVDAISQACGKPWGPLMLPQCEAAIGLLLVSRCTSIFLHLAG